MDNSNRFQIRETLKKSPSLKEKEWLRSLKLLVIQIPFLNTLSIMMSDKKIMIRISILHNAVGCEFYLMEILGLFYERE